jgi:hypothetical protein
VCARVARAYVVMNNCTPYPAQPTDGQTCISYIKREFISNSLVDASWLVVKSAEQYIFMAFCPIGNSAMHNHSILANGVVLVIWPCPVWYLLQLFVCPSNRINIIIMCYFGNTVLGVYIKSVSRY